MSYSDTYPNPSTFTEENERKEPVAVKPLWRRCLPDRTTYRGALVINLLAFLLPPAYAVLSRLWVDAPEASRISVAKTRAYMLAAVRVVNDGLPRAAYRVVGDPRRSERERVRIAAALIAAQGVLGTLLSVATIAAAGAFVGDTPSAEMAHRSTQYVRLGAFAALASALDAGVAHAARALDRPAVPLLSAGVQTLLRAALDLLFLSRVRVSGGATPVAHAGIRLVCAFAGALAGLAALLWLARPRRVGPGALRPLLIPGAATGAESAVRHILHLWLVSGVPALGPAYPEAWRTFNTIRWGLLMAPVLALQATAATFVGHEWGAFGRWRPTLPVRRATRQALARIVRPAFLSIVLGLMVEIPLCIFLSLFGVEPLARVLTRSYVVAALTRRIWVSVEWAWILHAISAAAGTVLLASLTWLFLAQSLLTSLLWVLPWTVVVHVHGLQSDSPWKWYAVTIAGSKVFDVIALFFVLIFWLSVVRQMARERVPLEGDVDPDVADTYRCSSRRPSCSGH